MHVQNSIKPEKKGEVPPGHPPDLYYLAEFYFPTLPVQFMQMFAFFPFLKKPFKDVLSSDLI